MKKIIAAIVLSLTITAPAFAQTYAKNGVTVIHEPAPQRSTRAPRLTTLDKLDIATTAIGIAGGAAEVGAAGVLGNAGAPLVGIGLKLGGKYAMQQMGLTPEQADRNMNVGSGFGAANNGAVILGGGAASSNLVAVAPLFGVLTAIAIYDMQKNNKTTEPRPEQWHGGKRGGKR
tara:strand:- start:3398 stop:3919 length:522 start_codon:yes stop_codon:yes gene_type:complete